MMKRGIKILVLAPAFVLAFALASCDDQRDLYTDSHPLLDVHGDWELSLGINDMSNLATAMIFKQGGGVTREYFVKFDEQTDDNSLTARLSGGRFDVVVFNGIMFDDDDTGLDYVEFRGSSRAETFEAVAAPATADKRLERASNEYIAANDMEILTADHVAVDITASHRLGHGSYLKYSNGADRNPFPQDYFTDTVKLTPSVVSYYAQVVVHMTNPGSAASGIGAVRGFSRSVMMASGLPSHRPATHHVRLGNVVMSGTNTGSVSSPVFVTFGPPLDLTQGENWTYELELSFTLRDGLVDGDHVYDITPQITAAAEQIRTRSLNNSPTNPIIIEIGLEDGLELPLVDSSVDVDPWENDETIKVPIDEDTEQVEQ